MDSLSANVCLAGLEQREWLAIRANTFGLTGVVWHYCLHHQGALAQRPLVLRLPGIPTGWVRSLLLFFRVDIHIIVQGCGNIMLPCLQTGRLGAPGACCSANSVQNTAGEHTFCAGAADGVCSCCSASAVCAEQHRAQSSTSRIMRPRSGCRAESAVFADAEFQLGGDFPGGACKTGSHMWSRVLQGCARLQATDAGSPACYVRANVRHTTAL